MKNIIPPWRYFVSLNSVRPNKEFLVLYCEYELLTCCLYLHIQDLCKMTTEAISSGQTSVQAELRRTANTRKFLFFLSFYYLLGMDARFPGCS